MDFITAEICWQDNPPKLPANDHCPDELPSVINFYHNVIMAAALRRDVTGAGEMMANRPWSHDTLLDHKPVTDHTFRILLPCHEKYSYQ